MRRDFANTFEQLYRSLTGNGAAVREPRLERRGKEGSQEATENCDNRDASQAGSATCRKQAGRRGDVDVRDQQSFLTVGLVA